MRRNLVAKKPPQQPIIKHYENFYRSPAGASTYSSDRIATDFNKYNDQMFWNLLNPGSNVVHKHDHIAFAGCMGGLRSQNKAALVAPSVQSGLNRGSATTTKPKGGGWKRIGGATTSFVGNAWWGPGLAAGDGTLTDDTANNQYIFDWNGTGAPPSAIMDMAALYGETPQNVDMIRIVMKFNSISGGGKIKIDAWNGTTYDNVGTLNSGAYQPEVVFYYRTHQVSQLQIKMRIDSANGACNAELDYIYVDKFDPYTDHLIGGGDMTEVDPRAGNWSTTADTAVNLADYDSAHPTGCTNLPNNLGVEMSGVSGQIVKLERTRNFGADDEANPYFKATVVITGFASGGGGNDIGAPVINGTIVGGISPINGNGTYTWYGRFDGTSNQEFGIICGLFGSSNVSFVVSSMDIRHYNDEEYRYSTTDTKGAELGEMFIGVRQGGNQAIVDVSTLDLQDNSIGVYEQWGDSKAPSQRTSSIDNYDRWFIGSVCGMIPAKVLWDALYAGNNAIGQEFDETVEWYLGLHMDYATASWNTPSAWNLVTQLALSSGSYEYGDALAEEMQLSYQLAGAIVNPGAWDGEWSRAYGVSRGFKRVISSTTNNVHEMYHSSTDNHDNLPNGFTLDAQGIVLGALFAFELDEVADGNNTASSTPAGRGLRGHVKFVDDGTGAETSPTGYSRYSYNYYPSYSVSNYPLRAPIDGESRMYTFIQDRVGQDHDWDTPEWDNDGPTNYHGRAITSYATIN